MKFTITAKYTKYNHNDPNTFFHVGEVVDITDEFDFDPNDDDSATNLDIWLDMCEDWCEYGKIERHTTINNHGELCIGSQLTFEMVFDGITEAEIAVKDLKTKLTAWVMKRNKT